MCDGCISGKLLRARDFFHHRRASELCRQLSIGKYIGGHVCGRFHGVFAHLVCFMYLVVKNLDMFGAFMELGVAAIFIALWFLV